MGSNILSQNKYNNRNDCNRYAALIQMVVAAFSKKKYEEKTEKEKA